MTLPTDDIPTTGILEATFGGHLELTPEISTLQMRSIVDAGAEPVFDSRLRSQFEAGHIPGAICLDVPQSEQVAAVRSHVGGDTSRPLVIYCNGPHCQQSRRLGNELATAGFSHVRRYQLGISVWRVLGGPTAVEIDWLERVLDHDDTAVLLDVRPAEAFEKGTLPRARSCPVDALQPGQLAVPGLPSDDFNRRVILFGTDAAEACRLARILSLRPWPNVSYVDATFAQLQTALGVSG